MRLERWLPYLGLLALAAAEPPKLSSKVWVPPGAPQAFNPAITDDGRLICQQRDEVLLYDPATGLDVARWRYPDAGDCGGQPWSVGDGVFAGSCGDQLALFPLDGGVAEETWRAPGPIDDLLISADGREVRALSSRADGGLWWESYARGQSAPLFHRPLADGAYLVQDGVLAALPGRDGGLVESLAGIDGGVLRRFPPGPHEAVSREGFFTLARSVDGGVDVASRTDAGHLWRTGVDEPYGYTTRFTRDGALLLHAADSHFPTMRFDARTGTRLAQVQCPSGLLSSVSPDGRWAASNGAFRRGADVCRLEGFSGDAGVKRVSTRRERFLLTPRGDALVAFDGDGLQLWSTASGTVMPLGLEDAGGAIPVAVGDHALLVEVGTDATLWAIDTRSPGHATRVVPPGELATPLAICPAADGGVEPLWSVPGGPLERIGYLPALAAVSLDCRRVAFVRQAEHERDPLEVVIASLPDVKPLRTFDVGGVDRLEFSDDGERLVVTRQSPDGFWFQLRGVKSAAADEGLLLPEADDPQVDRDGLITMSEYGEPHVLFFSGEPLVAKWQKLAPNGRQSSLGGDLLAELVPGRGISLAPLNTAKQPLPPGGPIGPLKWLGADDQRLVAIGETGALAFDVATGAPRRLPAEYPALDGKGVATSWAAGVRVAAELDNCVRIDRASSKPARFDSTWKSGPCRPVPGPPSGAAAISRDGNRVLMLSTSGLVLEWDVRQQALVRSVGEHSSHQLVALRADGNEGYSVDDQRQLIAWSLPGG